MNREADDSGFWLSMGVFGAEPRLHAFSYDVSAKKRGKFLLICLNYMRPPREEISRIFFNKWRLNLISSHSS